MNGRTAPVPEESARIEIACPGCGERFEKAFAWLKRHDQLQCPGCGTSFAVRRYKAQAGAVRLFEQLTGRPAGTIGS